MSRRKREAINAAAANASATLNNAKAIQDSSSGLTKLKNRKYLPAIGISLLLGLGAIGATVSNFTGNSGNNGSGSGWFSSSSTANPLPTPTPTPQLSKEYIYAGSRLLSTEQAGSSSTNSAPSDLVVWRLTSGSGYWHIKDA